MKKIYYAKERLSENISETPEGYLLCLNVPIARAGILQYGAEELEGLEANEEGYIEVNRSIDVLKKPESIASFESKPITLNHPPDFVTPEDWKQYAVGVVQNVRAVEDLLLADLLVTDRNAIEAVRTKRLREISCGDNADYI